MEQTPFNPETHRKDYEHTEAELSEVKESITGDKSNTELAELIAKRDALTADLEVQKAKAYDQADEDNENLTAEIEQYKEQIAEITGVTEEEREKLSSPELAEVIARLKDVGYLDTSFEGKETHTLAIRPLTKEQALYEYRNSGGMTAVWDELEENMPYTTPKAETLDVMMMNFNKEIGADEALTEMDKLGVRPLTYEEFIQYGIAHPSHQEQKYLLGLGTKHILPLGGLRIPLLYFRGNKRRLSADGWGHVWDDYRFPVVRK